jgi:hypothetical protein
MTRKFNQIKKDRLFYDKFEYSVGFYLDEASCLRVLDHASIDDIIERRKQWREIAQRRWAKSKNAGSILCRDWKEITETTVTDLHELAESLLTASTSFKLVVSVNQGHVYTNDVDLINRLDRLPQLKYKTYSQAVIDRPKNTIQLKKPRHKLRSYFRLINLTMQQKDQLAAFLENQQAQVRVSPALLEWTAMPFSHVQDYYFVDHDSETWLTMLNLVCPGIVRKTMHIIPAK